MGEGIMRRRARWHHAVDRRAVIAVALVGVLSLTACGHSGKKSDGGGGGNTASGAKVTLTPADNATEVPVSQEIGLKVTGGKITGVELVDAKGGKVPGELRQDGSSWVPAEALNYTTAYTATVGATSDSGKTSTTTTKFTTMASPGNRMDAHLYMADNATYGQAMPLVIEFGQGGVAAADRAAVERRLFVKTDPPQPGVWHWDSNIQIEYRAKDYWQPGTRITGKFLLGGLPVGKGRYGKVDFSIDATVDKVKRVIQIDDATKQLTALQDGQVVKTAPVSLGRPDKPSFSGTMVVMDRKDKDTFDSSTYGTPINSPDGYRTDVQFVERLTWDGQFIHAAPWSVAQQGHTNVSHGCVNISTDNAQWLYNWVKIGDPVVVKGTGHGLDQGNGFTAWDLSWEDFVKGSASPGSVPSPASS
jgi:lipoprotein-anchoring transpeptidase ErfK/SrfK